MLRACKVLVLVQPNAIQEGVATGQAYCPQPYLPKFQVTIVRAQLKMSLPRQSLGMRQPAANARECRLTVHCSGSRYSASDRSYSEVHPRLMFTKPDLSQNIEDFDVRKSVQTFTRQAATTPQLHSQQGPVADHQDGMSCSGRLRWSDIL